MVMVPFGELHFTLAQAIVSREELTAEHSMIGWLYEQKAARK